ncbi:hypothetical protein ACJ72_06274 [Emergomyces africanus]|uniref:Helicase ATP-binding domain-containing protein n=1 Tax=Emergomyces africanus TaxID=1955775 RepID=A0A1B7NRJ4_9EURO|nr:hypothetical protein ACJ72_06274 [Emergomyces africanus]
MNLIPNTIRSAEPLTSIDIARNNSFPTTSIAGTKRSHSGNVLSPQIPSINQQSIRTVGTSAALKADGFIRPTLSPKANKTRIIASQIRDVPGAVEIPNDTLSEYSQRQAVSSTPGPSQNPLLSLSHKAYGLPPQLVANFASLEGHPCSSLCCSRARETEMLRRVVEGVNKNIDTPVTADKAVSAPQWKQPQRSIRVTGFFGGSKTRATWTDTDIAVCTIEKANSLVNTAIEECKINDLGIVVLDELHMLDDEHRGYLIEIMVTKLMLLQQDIQIVGMSATLSVGAP